MTAGELLEAIERVCARGGSVTVATLEPYEPRLGCVATLQVPIGLDSPDERHEGQGLTAFDALCRAVAAAQIMDPPPASMRALDLSARVRALREHQCNGRKVRFPRESKSYVGPCIESIVHPGRCVWCNGAM